MIENENVNILADAGQLSGGSGGKSLASWYTHFGDPDFNKSSTPIALRVAGQTGTDRKLTVIDLGAGDGAHGLAIAEELRTNGWYIPEFIAIDLQNDALDQIPNGKEYPIRRLVRDITQTGLPSNMHSIMPTSRAIEHYLPKGGVERLALEVGRILAPGGSYIAEISSGDPVALKGFSAGLHAIARKAENFLVLPEYKRRVESVKDSDGKHLFSVWDQDFALAQERGPLSLAVRYLTPQFLKFNNGEQYLEEVANLVSLRDKLGQQVLAGKMDRKAALAEIYEAISAAQVYNKLFRPVFNKAVEKEWQKHDFQAGRGLRRDNNGDILITLTYPQVAWRRQETAPFMTTRISSN